MKTEADHHLPPLVIVQGTREKSQLADDARHLLFWLIQRLSLSPKQDCVFEFCFDGPKAKVPTQKKERNQFMEPQLDTLRERLTTKRVSNIVTLGLLPCECFNGCSILKRRAGTYWGTLPEWKEIGLETVWVDYSIEACLMQADLAVTISRSIGKCAQALGYSIAFDYSVSYARAFDLWLQYENYRK